MEATHGIGGTPPGQRRDGAVVDGGRTDVLKFRLPGQGGQVAGALERREVRRFGGRRSGRWGTGIASPGAFERPASRARGGRREFRLDEPGIGNRDEDRAQAGHRTDHGNPLHARRLDEVTQRHRAPLRRDHRALRSPARRGPASRRR